MSEEPSPELPDMTVLDYFAAAVLPVVAGSQNLPDNIAIEAYRIARAMMKRKALEEAND